MLKQVRGLKAAGMLDTFLQGCYSGWTGLPTSQRTLRSFLPFGDVKQIKIKKRPGNCWSWCCQSSSYLRSCRSHSLRCNRVSDYYRSCTFHGTNAAFTYNRGSAMPGHLHILHPSTWQQRHLKVEQVGLQIAARPGGAEAHPGRDRHGNPAARREGNNRTYPCFLAILSSRDIIILAEETETYRETELNQQPVQVDRH